MHWVASWGSAQQLTERQNEPPAPGLAHHTLRQSVFPTLSGARARVLLSNVFGDGPVTMHAVHIARATSGDGIDTASDTALSFSGEPSLTLAPGQSARSDPVDFELKALEKLAITIAFGSTPRDLTGHPGSRTTSYLAAGRRVSDAVVSGASTEHWYFIAGLEVLAPIESKAIVALGDSITDGRGSTTDANDRFPDQLARRLKANPATAQLAVVNMGIGGNAVVDGGLGPTARARFDRDVLGVPGARFVIVLEGVNDIGTGGGSRLIPAYRELIAKARGAGILAYGVPILPFGGSSYDTGDHESQRTRVNHWIRSSGEWDAVLDLEAAVRDPAERTRLLAVYDSGDQLHLSPAGYQRMADSLDLALFGRQ